MRKSKVGFLNELRMQLPSELQEVTPMQEHGGYRVKRDDLFEFAGVCGGKVRTCLALAQGAVGLITSGSRSSPQVNIVAHIAKSVGIPCRAHVPLGALSPELDRAREMGAEIIQHPTGYNSVIVKRAKQDLVQHQGWTEIPFGMQCFEAVRQTANQVRNIPATGRIVVPVGSGMSMAGILQGLHRFNRRNRVLGVMVGADPRERLVTFGPMYSGRNSTLVVSGLPYQEEAKNTLLGDLCLDPIYEAKCLPFLEKGDIFWCVGIRETVLRVLVL